MKPVALGAEAVGKCFGTTFKLNRFNVRMLSMHRWFDISAAERDLQYRVRELLLFLIAFCGFISRLKGGVGPALCRGATVAREIEKQTKQKVTLFLSPSSRFVKDGKIPYLGSKLRPFPGTALHPAPHQSSNPCNHFFTLAIANAPPMLAHTHPASFAGELAARILKDSRTIQCQYGEPFFRLAVLRSCFVCHAPFVVITEILVRSCAGWPQRQDSAKNRHSSWQASQCVACLAP